MKPFHPNLQARLQFKDDLPICPLCHIPMEFFQCPPGRLFDYYYDCKHHVSKFPYISNLNISHGKNKILTSTLDFYFKTQPDLLWAYGIHINFEIDRFKVDKEYESPQGEGLGYTPDILVTNIPGFNLFNPILMAKRIKLYTILS